MEGRLSTSRPANETKTSREIGVYPDYALFRSGAVALVSGGVEFLFAHPTPNTVGFSAGEGVVAALSYDGALVANLLCSFLTLRPGVAPFVLGMEERVWAGGSA